MNLTDIDLSKATPIDFDDIREGDTFVYADDCEIVVATAARVGDIAADQRWIAIGPHEKDRHFYSTVADAEWFLLDRPSPRVEPGTTGIATVEGERMRVMRIEENDYGLAWASERHSGLSGNICHVADEVTDFVADPAPGIPQELRDALDRLQDAFDGTGSITGHVQTVLDTYAEARDV